MTQIDIIDQIKTEIKVDADGKGTASLRAVERLAGVSSGTLSRALSSAVLAPSKLTQSLIGQGFEAAVLLEFCTQGIPDVAVAIILQYYAYATSKE